MASSPSTAGELRRAFCDFFTQQGHELVPSAGLVPSDPSLLFTVAGMVPFKEYFQGLKTPDFKRAVSVQKCLRAGGKHNDLEEIGRTNRHLSFFEMLGNFSFGDYFKEEAIMWAWEFSTEVLNFDPKDIWITVHIDDDEAEELWIKKVGVSPERVQRLDEPNYWSMGDTGPCGPCSELFLDRGAEYGDEGGPAKGGEERYMEFWNLVFMQYEKKEDGSMIPLPSPSIDTGAGLERILALTAGAKSIFDVGDLYELVQVARGLAEKNSSSQTPDEVSIRILAEHIRAAVFIIADGIIPSNEDRGYVLRRIIRRAIRHAHLLGAYKKNDSVVLPVAKRAAELAKDDYPQLAAARDKLMTILEKEEQRFLETLEMGGKILSEELVGLGQGGELSGSTAFKLHDTYGFPFDLTDEIAREGGFTVDKAGYEKEMAEQRERARADYEVRAESGIGVGVQSSNLDELVGMAPTEFKGNQEYDVAGRVLTVLDEGLVLDQTSFYAESGGQVGDTGWIFAANSGTQKAEVTDTVYGSPGVVLHRTKSKPPFKTGDHVQAVIDGERRETIRRHHTATHILHWALREVLGDHVSPQGSYVEAKRLRFDFSHWAALTPEEKAAVEDKCNEEILTNQPVRHFETTKAEADAMGAIAFFEEKYGDIVKVLEAGENSIELCGGTHVGALGDIGPLKIISESSIGANIRRVEAVCGLLPVQLLRKTEMEAGKAAEILGTSLDELAEGARKRTEEIKMLRQELGQLKSQSAMSQLDELAAKAENGILSIAVEGVDRDTLRKMALNLRDKEGLKAVILGASFSEGGAALVAALKPEASAKITAGEVLAEPAKLISGGGGKGEDLAIAGGKDSSGLAAALDLARETAQKAVS